MRSVIICVSGPPRTGKDTLLTHIRQTLGEHVGPGNVDVLSSIDEVKWFVNRTAAGKLRMLDSELRDRALRSEMRQCFASIKRALDEALNWTCGLAFARLAELKGPTVLLYQVREVENIKAIIEKGKSEGVAVLTMFVHRPGHQSEGMADTDHVKPGDHPWDFIVTNTALADLPDWADLVAKRAYRLFVSSDGNTVRDKMLPNG